MYDMKVVDSGLRTASFNRFTTVVDACRWDALRMPSSSHVWDHLVLIHRKLQALTGLRNFRILSDGLHPSEDTWQRAWLCRVLVAAQAKPSQQASLFEFGDLDEVRYQWRQCQEQAWPVAVLGHVQDCPQGSKDS